MSDLHTLAERAEFTARLADLADESVDGTERRIENLRAALADSEDYLDSAITAAKEARAAADEAAAALEDASAQPVDGESVAATLGAATGSASA